MQWDKQFDNSQNTFDEQKQIQTLMQELQIYTNKESKLSKWMA